VHIDFQQLTAMQHINIPEGVILCLHDNENLNSGPFSVVNETKLVHSLFLAYLYYQSLDVSGDYVPIIRRNDCVFTTLGTKCRKNTVARNT
jgi:hypothetical protein